MEIKLGYYKLRNDVVVEIVAVKDDRSIWPVDGHLIHGRQRLSWTSKGGYSPPPVYKEGVEILEHDGVEILEHDYDIIEYLIPKKYPEYYL